MMTNLNKKGAGVGMELSALGAIKAHKPAKAGVVTATVTASMAALGALTVASTADAASTPKFGTEIALRDSGEVLAPQVDTALFATEEMRQLSVSEPRFSGPTTRVAGPSGLTGLKTMTKPTTVNGPTTVASPSGVPGPVTVMSPSGISGLRARK